MVEKRDAGTQGEGGQVTVDKNRMFTLTREFGQFKATASFYYDKKDHEVRAISDINADYRGKSGTQLDKDLDEMMRWLNRCIQGRELK